MGKRSNFARVERDFWSKADCSGDCWIWTGCVGGDGYGHVRHNGRVRSAHRVAFELANAREPSGHILHSCDNPLCVNPGHLNEGTHQENMRECASRGRNKSARVGNGKQKLTPENLTEIRLRFACGEMNKSELARVFSVTPSRIRQVIHG